MDDTDNILLKHIRFFNYLIMNGYRNVRLLDDGRWVGTMQFMFTYAIIVGQINDTVGYDDRWCYHSEADAEAALKAWSDTGCAGEPDGWHRHPRSGRRRNADGTEYVNF